MTREQVRARLARLEGLGRGATESAVRAVMGRPTDVMRSKTYKDVEYGPVHVYNVTDTPDLRERVFAGFDANGLAATWAEIRAPKSRSSPPSRGAAVAAKLAPHARPAWIPVTETGLGRWDGSRFGGAAALRAGEGNPVCGRCGGALPLLLQLSADELPPAAGAPFGPGLLQLFYCTNTDDDASCEADGEAWEAFAPSVVARVVPTRGLRAGARVPACLPPRRIASWREVDDRPSYDDAAELGVNLSADDADALTLVGYPRTGDKLLGWPAWVQGPERPPCPDCGEAMRELFQLDSDGNVPLMFGDMGTGHLFQCGAHPSRVAFAWACA